MVSVTVLLVFNLNLNPNGVSSSSPDASVPSRDEMQGVTEA